MTLRRVVLVLPGLVDSPAAMDVLNGHSEAFARLVEESRVFRLSPPTDCETPESAWLGVDPSRIVVAQGPLTVSAFRLSPPSGSVDFHLSLASVTNDGRVLTIDESVSPEEAAVLKPLLSRLSARNLTPVWGEGTDHALVWESGSLDLGTTPISKATGSPLSSSVPEGDGERILRRLIDDSVNLLTDLELNRRRADKGRSRLNLLWPWGQGMAPDLPNLALRRGEVVHYESRSQRLDGLVRMVGYRHGNRGEFGRKLRPDWNRLNDSAMSHDALVIFSENIQEAARHERWDEAGAMFHELTAVFLRPLSAQRPVRIGVLCPSSIATQEGLALVFDSERKTSNPVPFDGRVIEDSKVQRVNAWEFVERLLRP